MLTSRLPPLRLDVLVVAAIVALAWAAESSGLDHALAVAAFDTGTGAFVGNAWPDLARYGHKWAKNAVWLVWLALFATSIASHRVAALAPYRRVLWATTIAMGLGPAVVSTLKMFTGPRCPWDLIEFGGTARAATGLFVARSEAGRCFPGGHASGGFSLLALYFAGLAIGEPRLRRAGLALGLIGGAVFGAIRMIQGAHFLSHNLWSLAVVWTMSAIVFRIAYPGGGLAAPDRPQPVAR